MNTIEQLQKLSSDINEVLILGSEGLLKSERLYKTKHEIEEKRGQVPFSLSIYTYTEFDPSIINTPKERNFFQFCRKDGIIRA